MKIVFIGAVVFSASALHELIAMGADVVGVCTLSNSSFNADHQDLAPIAQAAAIPVCPVTDVNSQEGIDWIHRRSPDVIFCFGWSRLIREPLLSLPKLGVIGFHPAALPANRGRHPIIWALVLGLSQTASTFFKMDQGADSGDIVSQVMLDIRPSDDAHSLYQRITKVALTQLHEFVPQLANGSVQLMPQTHRLANSWRKRGSVDGCIDWRMAATSIHNLVRGLTRPYVGAHFDHEDQMIKVWQTEIVTDVPYNLEPGKVLEVADTFLLVKAGIGAIKLVEYSPKLLILPGSYL
jgi:methionyl-tRNA formyltransferase